MVFVPLLIITLAASPTDTARSTWLMVVLLISAALPVTIWWREASQSAASQMAELIASSIAALAGAATLIVASARIGFLLTGPYTGPMSAEATLFFLIGWSLAWLGSLLLLTAPLLLDAAFFPPKFRARAWKTLAVTVPAVALFALSVGARYDWLFR